jgi:hypothetical protein
VIYLLLDFVNFEINDSFLFKIFFINILFFYT